MWSNLMHTLYVGRRVALYALVLVPQHMQQRFQLSIDGHEEPVSFSDCVLLRIGAP